jgi:hypothetical protein
VGLEQAITTPGPRVELKLIGEWKSMTEAGRRLNAWLCAPVVEFAPAPACYVGKNPVIDLSAVLTPVQSQM